MPIHVVIDPVAFGRLNYFIFIVNIVYNLTTVAILFIIFKRSSVDCGNLFCFVYENEFALALKNKVWFTSTDFFSLTGVVAI